MIPAILISAYRFFFKARFRAVTYLLNPGCRFYFMFIARFLFIFLIFAVIVWLPIMTNADLAVMKPKGGLFGQFFAFTPILDYFYYFFFPIAEDGSNVASVYFEPDDSRPDPISMSMALYQVELFDMDSDYEELEEEWEDNFLANYLPDRSGGQYTKDSEDANDLAGPFILHIDDRNDMVEAYMGLLIDDHKLNLDLLSSLERVYKSGFFDYGYNYDYKPSSFFEEKEFSLSPISVVDFNLEKLEVVYDEIITIDLDRTDAQEKKIIINTDNPILGLENSDLNFINYANEYSRDVYRDVLRPGVRISRAIREPMIDRPIAEDIY